jgi:hypothetical protein
LIRAVAVAAGAFTGGPLGPVAPFSALASVAFAAFLRHRVTCHHAEACGSHHQFVRQFFHHSNQFIYVETRFAPPKLQLNTPTGEPA